MNSKKNIIIGLVILAAATWYSLQFYRVNITCDENYNINIVKRILDGDIPYRDFHLHQTPGAYYIQAAIFKVFGKELLVSRLVTLFLGLCVFVLLFCISRRIVSGYFTLIASFSYLFWGTAHQNFLSSSLYSTFFGLLQLLVFLKYLENNRKSYLFLSGFLAGTVFLMKQSLGAPVLLYTIAALFYFTLLDKNDRPLKPKTKIFLNELVVLVCSFGLGIAPFGLLFWAQGALLETVTCMRINMLQYANHTQTSFAHPLFWLTPSYELKLNWFYGLAAILLLTCFYLLLKWAYSLIRRQNIRLWLFILSSIGLTTLAMTALFMPTDRVNAISSFLTKNTERVFIYIPYILLVISLLWLIGKIRQKDPLSISDKRIVAITLFVFFYVYFSFLYSANFARQILAYPVSYLLLAFWTYKFINWEYDSIGPKQVRIYFLSLLFGIFTFTGFWVAYMQYADKEFMAPITTCDTPLEIPGGKGILVSSGRKYRLESIVRYIKTNTAKDECIFVFPYDALFYLFTDRKSPAYYDWFTLGLAPFDSQPEIIENMERKKVRYVILRDYNSERFPTRKLYPMIENYLLNDFFPEATFGNFSILRKKGDTVLSPSVKIYEGILPRFKGLNLLTNDDFEDYEKTSQKLAFKGWGISGLTVGVDKDTPKHGSSALTLYPTVLNQYLAQEVKLNNKLEEEVTFGIWAKGPEAPTFIRLRISTSDEHFYEMHKLSSTWMFYTVKGKLTEKDKTVGVFIFPDNGVNSESISSIEIDGALLVYGDIPSINDIVNKPKH